MPSWTVDGPRRLTLTEPVDQRVVRLSSGRVGLAGRTGAGLVSGPVEALGVSGDLTMETVSGELILADGTAEQVRAGTVSGVITCDLGNPVREHRAAGPAVGGVRAR
ncbi:hypothetical protein ACQEVC_03260 [Plantactinospora sp. CA-294935]|uniref:hypothetical protein n=1 Tax=Plantactinospora sp. CA-294935 TaxID=3240012 RepID=UPI003D932150